jgi:hypothetical protein
MVHRSIIKYDTDIQQDLFSNIILAGGQFSNSINTKWEKARLHVLPKNLGVYGSTMGVQWEYDGSMGVRESRFSPLINTHSFGFFF